MRFCHPLPAFLATLLVLVSAPMAPALIAVKMPIEKIYRSVKTVAVASVVSVNAENRVLELKTTELLKGPPVGETFRVQIAAPAELIAKVAAGQPLVIMLSEDLGKPVALIHVADTWLLAESLPAAATPAWRVVQIYDGKRSFPGRTADLVKALASLKAPEK